MRHIDVISGQPLLCDRQVIRDCVCRWLLGVLFYVFSIRLGANLRPDIFARFCGPNLAWGLDSPRFGSVESFESCVQTKVPAALGQRLGRFALPLHWVLGICITNFWGGAELIVARLREGEFYFALAVGLHALSWKLGAVPGTCGTRTFSVVNFEPPK